MPEIQDVVVVTTMGDDEIDSVSFTIVGKPAVQNGWKMAWKKPFRQPFLYDPKKGEKAALRAAVKAALRELTRAQLPVFRGDGCAVSVNFKIHQSHVFNKDLDNLAKFLLDALEGALFDNDKWVMSLLLTKVPSDDENDESTEVHVCRTNVITTSVEV